MHHPFFIMLKSCAHVLNLFDDQNGAGRKPHEALAGAAHNAFIYGGTPHESDNKDIKFMLLCILNNCFYLVPFPNSVLLKPVSNITA